MVLATERLVGSETRPSDGDRCRVVRSLTVLPWFILTPRGCLLAAVAITVYL